MPPIRPNAERLAIFENDTREKEFDRVFNLAKEHLETTGTPQPYERTESTNINGVDFEGVMTTEWVALDEKVDYRGESVTVSYRLRQNKKHEELGGGSILVQMQLSGPRNPEGLTTDLAILQFGKAVSLDPTPTTSWPGYEYDSTEIEDPFDDEFVNIGDTVVVACTEKSS